MSESQQLASNTLLIFKTLTPIIAEQYNPAMSRLPLFFAVVLVLASSAFSQSATKRYLYLSMPDGSQKEGRSDPPGILIFDIDNGHKFVRRIKLPIFSEGLRGFAGNLKTHRVYFGSTNRRLGAFDLETEKVVWEKTYEAGCDRSAITMDGKKIYVPTGWWYSGPDSGYLIVNAENGELIKRVNVGTQAHNSIVSLDGKRMYLGTTTMLSIFDTATDRLIRQIKDVGERGIFPYTMDSRQKIGYVCLGDHVGFDVVDLQAGKALHRVFAGDKQIPHRTHGVALTPDETELWISDQVGQKLVHLRRHQDAACTQRPGRVVPRWPWLGVLQPRWPLRMVSRARSLRCQDKEARRDLEGRAWQSGEWLQVHRSPFPRWQSRANGQ